MKITYAQILSSETYFSPYRPCEDLVLAALIFSIAYYKRNQHMHKYHSKTLTSWKE